MISPGHFSSRLFEPSQLTQVDVMSPIHTNLIISCVKLHLPAGRLHSCLYNSVNVSMRSCLSVMSSSCQKRNTYFEFVQILMSERNYILLYILRMYIIYIFLVSELKKNMFSINRIGQFVY